MARFLAGIRCKLWVNDILWWGKDVEDLLCNLGVIFGCLEDAGLFAAAHKCMIYDTQMVGGERCFQGIRWVMIKKVIIIAGE